MSRFAAPDGTSLAYTEVGTGPRLLCVPGGPGRASAYLEDLGGLADERTLVLLDGYESGRQRWFDDVGQEFGPADSGTDDDGA